MAAFATTTASIAAAWLDCKLGNAQAIQPLRHRTGIFSVATGATVYRCTLWRVVLQRLVLALADQQLITGIALLLCGFITERHALNGSQMLLIVYLSILSSSSHLACVITLREYIKNHTEVAYIRICAIIFFANLLFVAIILISSEVWVRLVCSLYIYSPVALLLSFDPLKTDIRLIIQKWLSEKNWDKFQKQMGKIMNFPRIVGLFSAFPFLVFLTQIVYFVGTVCFTLVQRVSHRNGEQCSSRDNEVNQWGFGQTLPMFLLLLPLLSAAEAYYGNSLRISLFPLLIKIRGKGCTKE